MKWVSLICFLFFLFIRSLNAQESDNYRPFIEEGKVWVSRPPMNMSYVSPQQKIVGYYYFQGDTVVTGKHCKKWIQDYRNLDGETLVSWYVTMYEENRKVWFFFKGETEPRLAYDFGAKVGDTLSVVAPAACYYDDLKEYSLLEDHYETFYDTIVIKKRVVQDIMGQPQETIYFSSIVRGSEYDREYWQDENYWMVGIGTHCTPEYNLSFVGQNMGKQNLFYCMVNDETLYSDEEYAKFWGVTIPSDILSPKAPSVTGNGIYDLTGRRLSARPTKGLYIEDGKIRMGAQK